MNMKNNKRRIHVVRISQNLFCQETPMPVVSIDWDERGWEHRKIDKEQLVDWVYGARTGSMWIDGKSYTVEQVVLKERIRGKEWTAYVAPC